MTEGPTGAIPPEPPPERNVGWGLVVGLLMLLVAGAGVAAGYVVAANTRDTTTVTTTVATTASAGAAPQKDVPSVVGLDETKAVARLADAGFRTSDRFRATAEPDGTVVSQDPEAGAKAATGTTIELVVDRGEPKSKTVVVPSVEGQLVSAAQERLRGAGLASSVFVIPADATRGNVTAQNPKAGEKADRGSVVRLNVSAGPATGATTETTTQPTTTRSATTTTTGSATVPDVVGLSRAEATQKLSAAGLVGSFVAVPSSEPEGTVVAQAKPAGTTLPRGSRIQINVSNGQG